MGATAFVGDWRSGKTLGLVEWLCEGKAKGYEVASNFGFFGGIDFSTADELLGLVAARMRVPIRERVPLRVAFDEAGVLFPCRGSSKFPPAMELVCNEARKLKIEVAYAVPNITRVDLNLRLATSRVVTCHAWLPKTLDHPEYGEMKSDRIGVWTEHAYANDKMEGRCWFTSRYAWGRHWWTAPEVQKYRESYNTYFLIESVSMALERAALELRDSREDYGDADRPLAPQVADAGRTRSSSARKGSSKTAV